MVCCGREAIVGSRADAQMKGPFTDVCSNDQKVNSAGALVLCSHALMLPISVPEVGKHLINEGINPKKLSCNLPNCPWRSVTFNWRHFKV